MKRRDFLKYSAPAGAVFTSLLNGLSVKTFGATGMFEALSGAADNDHLLVLLQLAGGNDSLNTVIPLDIYGAYNSARTNIAIPQGNVLPLDKFDKAGLHPAMSGLQKLYNSERMAVIQGVSYPSPNQSHFRAMDIWLSGADANQYLNTGWAGRALLHEYSNFPAGFPNSDMPDPLAIQIGTVLSPAFLAPGGIFTAMAVNTDIDFYSVTGNFANDTPDTPAGNELAYLRQVAKQTDKYASVIAKAAAKAKNLVSYPDTSLANQLKTVARLIAGGLKTKVYMVSVSGYDTHGSQVQAGNTITGIHASLLKELSEAVSCFMQDVTALKVSKRVLGLTFSEFGRRIISNGSGGTDHGVAQSLFLFGDYVSQGVLGKSPQISSSTKVGDSIPMQYDFRSVYATILRDWFCIPADQVETILFKNYQYLPLIKTTACTTTINDLNDVGDQLLTNYPNPFTESTTVSFTIKKGHVLIQVFDVTGRLITTLVDKEYAADGTYTIPFGAFVATGIYYARLQNGAAQQVRTMMKAR